LRAWALASLEGDNGERFEAATEEYPGWQEQAI
jgi:hypothetical protein